MNVRFIIYFYGRHLYSQWQLCNTVAAKTNIVRKKFLQQSYVLSW